MQEFVEGPFSQSNLDPGASMLIPVPGPQGGVVVVGESVIAYVRKRRGTDDQAVKSIQINATIVKVSLTLAARPADLPLTCSQQSLAMITGSWEGGPRWV